MKKTINLGLQWSCLGPWLISNWVAAAWRANLSFLLPNFKRSDVDNGGEDSDGVDVCGCQDFFWMNQTVCINICGICPVYLHSCEKWLTMQIWESHSFCPLCLDLPYVLRDSGQCSLMLWLLMRYGLGKTMYIVVISGKRNSNDT